MRAAAVAILVLVAGCASAPRTEPALISGPITRRAVVLVADSTLAPEGLATTRVVVEATLELAKADDVQIGVLAATSEGARVVSPLGDSQGGPIEATQGRALVGKGCRRALDALIAAEAVRGSLVVLLAPKLEGEDAREVDRASREASARGYRILRAPVESGARTALAEIASEGFSFLAAKGAPAGITPQGGRVVALGLAPLAVKAWSEPPRARLEVPKGTDLLLYRPSWTIELEKDAPPPLAMIGDPVPVGLVINGASASGLLVDAKARASGRTVVLARSATRTGLRFEGEVEAPRVEGPCELAFDLSFAAGDAVFEHERVFRYLAKRREGTPPPTVRVTPAKLDVGPVWSDSRTEVKLRVTGDPTRPVKILVESLFAQASDLPLAPGEEKDLVLVLDARKLASGDKLKLRAEVTLVATAAVRPIAKGERVRAVDPPGQAPPRQLSVPITCEPFAVKIPQRFDLGRVRAGETVTRTFPLRGARLEAKALAEDDLGITAAIEGENLVVRVAPKEGAAAGARTARVEVALAGSRAPPLVRDLGGEVEAAPRELALSVEPGALRLRGRAGWAEARVRVSSTVAARLDAQPGALASSTARIGPRRDIRVKAADASWDARSLGAGEERELVVRVYVGSDLPAGTYEGTLALEARVDAKSVAKPLPVSIEVER